ncbi:MAG TPA: MMPL family transporter [Acidimicrobiales bacterium]|nr:MMPL family transporter [Acidimicrobiales bacterium]
MIRLADFCYRRRRFILGGWVLALILIFVAGSALPADHRASYQTPGAESTRAYSLLNSRFPSQKGDSVKVVFAGDIRSPAVRPLIDAEIAKVASQPHVTGVSSPFSAEGSQQISRDGRVAYAEVQFDQTFDKLTTKDANFAKHFLAAAHPGKNAGLDIEVTTLVAGQQLGSEAIGLVFAAFILILAFGSALAAGLPLLTALFGLGIGATLGGIASRVFETPDWAPTVATMIGLGVGIDYALFIITRYRQSLAKGLPPRDAVLTAMGTAGRAVLFAGGTVVISLLGMLTMGLSYLQGVAASSVLAVLVVLAASLTLLPAILGFVGRTIDRLRVPFTGRASHQGQRAFWYRWSRVVQRRPWLAFGGAVAILAVITVPVLSLRFGFPDDGNNPKTETSRQAYDLLTTGFGAGFNGPLLMVVDLKGATDPTATLTRISGALAPQPGNGIAAISPPIRNATGDTAIVNVFPTHSPQDKATTQLVNHLRNAVIPPAIAGSGAHVLVGGATAISIDQSSYITHRLPLFIGAVVLLSFLLLTMVFRSPLVAVKAGVMNLLSIAAAYGVMSYAANGSWLGRLLKIPVTPIPAFIPMIMFAILFGLSMDYEVFLLSRIREEYLRTGDNAAAVADGLASTARVITAAAAIMVFVFGVFIFDPNVFIKQIGLGLAAAVVVDATIIRMVLVPATMELLGDANWWMPRWLGRLLPEIHIESEESLELELAAILAGEEPVPV